ncbi:MAG: T9SS type A sorting domain-containing protein, partial [Sphingobacteriales bacterium]
MKKFIHYSRLLTMLILLLFAGNAKAQTYCSISGTGCQYNDFIQSFSTTNGVTNITNNSTGCIGTSPAYVFYSSMTVSAVQGTSINISVTNGTYCCGERFSIWVDWNHDGDFTDAGEAAWTSSSSSTSAGQVFTGSISVPPTATPATTRMRVMCSYGGYGSPCATYYSDGEVEDYNFQVLAACQTPLGLAASNVASNTADFNWTAVPSVLGYEYVIDNTSASPTTAGTLVTTNSYSASGLNSSTAYYFHVRTKCSATAYSNWAAVPFTTLFNPCPYPTGVSFTPNGTSVATFNWTPVSGSGGYEYIVRGSSSTPMVSGSATTATTATVNGLTGGNTYYFFLRNACTPSGLSDWTRLQFTMPECHQPGNIIVTSVSDTSADFIWGTMPSANYYEYQVDQVVAPPVGGSGFSTATGMSAHVENLIPQTTYYVHLRSKCYVNDSSEWKLDSLVTQMGCLRPSVVITGAQTNNPSARWDAVPGAMSYEYRVTTSANVPAYGTETANTFTGPIALKSDGKDYYLHVRTKCTQFSFSRWVTQPLRVAGPTGVANISNGDFNIDVYPNPAKDKLQIRLAGNTGKNGSILLTDITGKIIVKTEMTDNVLEVSLDGLSAGMYMLKYADDSHARV